MADMELSTLGQGSADSEISIDQISTMTLSEFKQLISNNLSVPLPGDKSGEGSADSPRSGDMKKTGGPMKRSSSADAQNLSWSSVRDKARSVCNSLASSVSSRRPTGGSSASIIARRNLPKSPAPNPNRPKTPSSVERPKTPSGVERPKTPSNTERPKTPSGIGGDRPKTPVSSYRPKTPVTSAYAYRPKTPSSSTGEGQSKPPVRPKTPTGIGSTRGTVNAVISRNSDGVRPRTPSKDMERTRPKTPSRDNERAPVIKPQNSLSRNSKPETVTPRIQNTTVVSEADCITTNPRVKSSTFVYTDESDNASVDNSEVEPQSSTGLGLKSASFASSMDNEESSVSVSLPISRRTQSQDDLDEDSSEICEMMETKNIEPSSVPVRERPATPSRIPRPALIARPSTPSSSENTGPKTTPAGKPSGTTHRVLPHPSTPVGRSSSELQLSVEGAVNDKPPVTPRRASVAGRSANTKSYTEMFHARRAQTPGPGSSSSSSSTVSTARPTTPGPSFGSKTQTPANAQKSSLSKTVDLGKLRKAKSVTNLLESRRLSTTEMSLPSDDKTRRGSVTQKTLFTGSQQRLQRQNASDSGGGEVLMVSRNKQGQHSVQITDQNRNVTYNSPATRGRLQQSASVDSERPRSKTPGPGVGTRYQPRSIIRKPSQPPTAGQKGSTTLNKPFNRTEAWVDSTLHDPKRKQLPPRPRRPKTPNSLSIAESELLSRPLEEIQAALPSPVNSLPTPEEIEAPPEDPEMYKKMEQLFEKYREMELRASVCDTPGGGNQEYGSQSVTHVSSGRGQGVTMCGQSLSSRSSSSVRNGVANSASFSSGISSGLSQQTDSSRGPSVENDRFSKESSPAAAAATAPSFYSNGAASNNGEYHDTNMMDDSACVSVTPRSEHQGAPAVSADDIVDVDDETLTSNPSALVSKIKDILQVRPRKEDTSKTGTKSRIPAPAFLSRSRRSKSVSNIMHESSLLSECSFSVRETVTNGVDPSRDESTNSDVSSDYSRCETPVPKLSQPLITGRSTLFHRERSVGGERSMGGGRSMSQDDHVSNSSSQSSSSKRYWDEDGEYV